MQNLEHLVILDAGHGINTPGKRSPIWNDGSQLFEWEFNRDIVNRIISKLEEDNIPYIKLINEDSDVSLSTRVRKINTIYKQNPNCYVVSIHANAGGGTGWEIFTSEGQTTSDYYANIFYEYASEYLSDWKLRTDMSDGDVDKESQFYILKNTYCPAVLVENMFMDTERDCKFIMSDEGRETIAMLCAEAIKDIYTNKGV